MAAVQRKASGLEDMFAHEQEVMFKVEARRNRLIGLWAAAAMGRDNAENYADALVADDIAHPHSVLTRLRQDFDAAGVDILDDDLQSQMVSLLKDAARDMRSL